MVVAPHPDQSGIDTALAVAEQQFHSDYPSRVHALAKSWADGLKGILGISGFVGIVGAPIASKELSGTTTIVVGSLLSGVFAVSTCGLLFVQAAASGTTKSYQMPDSMLKLVALQRRLANRAVHFLRAGRALACLALILFGIAVMLVWIDPWKSDQSSLRVTTSAGGTYCGTLQPSADGVIIIEISPGAREAIRLQDVRQVTAAPPGCNQ